MKTSAARPRAGQFWVCRDGRTLEPDFMTGSDLTGFTAQQVAFAASDGSLTGSANLTWNGTTFGVGGGVSATSLTDSGLTSGRVTFATTAGLLTDSANLTYGSGKLSISDGTPSTSSTTGTLVIGGTGGVGIGGRLSVAGGTNGSTHITTVGNYGFIAFGGTADFTTGTGIAGGAASDPDFYFVCPDTRGFHFRINGSDSLLVTQSQATLTGALLLTTASSGVTIDKTTGTTLIVLSTAAASSTTTGCAKFGGGVGIGGAIFAAGNIVSGTNADPFSRGYGNAVVVSGAGSAAVTINAATGTAAHFDLGVNGTRYCEFTVDTSSAYFGSLNSATVTLGYNGSTKVTLDGSALTSSLPIVAPASTTSIPSVRLPHGAAPSSPTNGDMWTTTAGLFVRINGVTVGPLT